MRVVRAVRNVRVVLIAHRGAQTRRGLNNEFRDGRRAGLIGERSRPRRGMTGLRSAERHNQCGSSLKKGPVFL